MTDGVFDVSESGSVTITLKSDSGHDMPWIVVRYASVKEALAAFKKDDGAELMELFRNVAGAAKAFKMLYHGQDPEVKSQGKPEGANRPSPQVTLGTSPFKGDDAPPFGVPDNPTCKHGTMTKVTHNGVTGFVCPSGLAKGDPNRCPSVM